jgi:hypothetical protein
MKEDKFNCNWRKTRSYEMLRHSFLPLALLLVVSKTAAADQVMLHTLQYGCELKVFGQSRGRVEPDAPLTIDLPRGREYLVECESHDIPVKLYARINVFARGDIRTGSLPTDIKISPVAVLPNVVQAAALSKIDVKTTTNTSSVACEVGPEEKLGRKSRQIAPLQVLQIPAGTAVQLSGERQIHCGDTNLIEVMVGGSKALFPNRDFSFSYKGKPISLFPPSQDLECCWIE